MICELGSTNAVGSIFGQSPTGLGRIPLLGACEVIYHSPLLVDNIASIVAVSVRGKTQ
jgi:hypothetical protein